MDNKANAKLDELMHNEEFLHEILEVKDAKALEELFKKNDLVLEDGMTYDEAFRIAKNSASDELGEEELKNVSGGVLGLAAGALAVGCLTVGGGAISFLCGYARRKFRRHH